MRVPVRSLLVSSLAALPLCGCGVGGDGSPGHGVLLIAVESLRADHLSSYGYDRQTTPGLDELAAGGVLFERALAASPLRLPSHAALLTGSDPNLSRRMVPQWREATLDQAWNIPREVPRLAVELAVAGYRTAAFVDDPELAGGFGFDAGFHTYVHGWEADDPQARGIDSQSFRLRQWLRGVDRDEDWFSFVHLADLERIWIEPDAMRDTYFEPRPELDMIPPVGGSDPCLFAIPPSRWLGGSFTLGQQEARYDGSLRSLDENLARLLRDLDADGRLENTTICIVGSYGVQFGEAGMLLDHGRLSAADLHVPWILKPAADRALAGGVRVDSVASLCDVAPTLLELCGVPIPPRMLGLSQLAVARGEAEAPPREYAFASCAIQGGYAVFEHDWALEVVFPTEASERLVEAWYGFTPEQPGEVLELHYRWFDDPYPALYGTPPRTTARARLRRAGSSWIGHVENLRSEVQVATPFFLPEAPEDAP
ncbi:sulfatase [Engelhardtia mirabilis]|uniref:Sulfatase n=1 Tax=Engelhardtia mirabilis TaxID=2528011 RepID=A0A518BIG1_9BACT|nr:Sulfatase [Planctomycetes bacterium Pla133]QDV01095.1 Sulfatase [Planctomycetes bacterium Pla86]